jgi:hypothetical protein
VPPQLKGSGFTTSAKRVGPLNPFYHCIRISPLIASPGQPTGFYWLSAASLQLTCGMSAIHPKQLPAINIFRNPGDENPVRVTIYICNQYLKCLLILYIVGHELVSLETPCSLYQHKLSRVEHPPSQYGYLIVQLFLFLLFDCWVN